MYLLPRILNVTCFKIKAYRSIGLRRNIIVHPPLTQTLSLREPSVIFRKIDNYLPTGFTCNIKKKYFANSGLSNEFNEICEETLDSVADYFEELIETISLLKNGDISYSDGVITASLGNNLGTYVINRQTPNQQIWLSSPLSGPKRYDFINGLWIYKHDNTTLHNLLDREIGDLTKSPVDFSSHCKFGKRN